MTNLSSPWTRSVAYASMLFLATACDSKKDKQSGGETQSPTPKQEVSKQEPPKPIAELNSSLVGKWRSLDGSKRLLLNADGTYEEVGGKSGKYSEKDGKLVLSPLLGRSDENPFLLRGDTLAIFETDSVTDLLKATSYKREEGATGGSVRPSKVLPTLQEVSAGLSVTGTLKAEKKDFKGFNQSGTRMRWTLDLEIINATSHDFATGSILIAAQISTQGSPTGYLRVRGADPFAPSLKTPKNPHVPYYIDDFDSTDGGQTIYLEGARFGMAGSGKHPADAGFGVVPARAKRELVEFISPYLWLKQGAIQGMKIVLPDFIAVGEDKSHRRFHAVANLKKVTGDEDKAEWTVEGLQLYSSDVGELSAMLANGDIGIFPRILAMNWLIQADADKAGAKLAELTAGINSGELLGVALRCFREWNLAGFEERALQLEESLETPFGIVLAAGSYLDTRSAKRNWKSLTSNSAPDGIGDTTTTSINESNWVATKIRVSEPMILRRIRATLNGPASDHILTLHSDAQGLPGAKMADLEGVGGETRCKQTLQPGMYWVVAKRPPSKDRLAAWWPLVATSGPFDGYAVSKNGGASWTPGSAGKTGACEIWYE